MILKTADDKSPQIVQLEKWLEDSALSVVQKQWLKDELFRLRMGIQGEREAAFYLDSHFKDSENHVVIHDLRIEIDDEVAQIDHLVFNRFSELYLFETKNYSGSLVINDHGEFTADYGRVRYGIPSPIEQNRRHERVLRKMFERLDIGGRTQRQMRMHHVVLVHPKAIIQRPAGKLFNTDNIIKADQIPDWHKKFAEKRSPLEVVSVFANVRKLDTVQEWGEMLIRRHCPAPMRKLPEHLFPAEHTVAEPVADTLLSDIVPPETAPVGLPTVLPSILGDKAAIAKKLICAECGAKITFAEGKFCWGNERRFAGLQYCRAHQPMFQ